MTNLEIEIAIAKTRGWIPRFKVNTIVSWIDSAGSVWMPNSAPQYTERLQDILWYTKGYLKGTQTTQFIREIVAILDRDNVVAEDLFLSDVCEPVDMSYHILMATPLQFCEAFLKTLGLWTTSSDIAGTLPAVSNT